MQTFAHHGDVGDLIAHLSVFEQLGGEVHLVCYPAPGRCRESFTPQKVEALRTLRLLHYSAWLARRWDDPAFPMAFPWFNTVRYWQDRILEMREQIAAMQEPPLVPS